MDRAPTFHGRKSNVNEVDDFIDNFKTYCIVNRITGDQKLDLFDSLIRQPAKQEYDDALADDMVWPAALAADALPAAIAADYADRLNIRIVWLRNQYQGPQQYQAVRQTLTLLRQGSHENPRDFYNRVIRAYDLSGYPAAAKDVLIGETWERGLDPYIQQVIRQGPNYETNQKLEVANNTWQYHFQNATSVNYDYLSPQEEPQDLPAPRKAPIRVLQRPTTVRKAPAQPEPTQRLATVVDDYEGELQKMIEKYQKLEAHVANIERKFDRRDYPVRTFGNANRFPDPRNQLDPRDQRTHQEDRPQRERPGGRFNPNLSNQGVCFRCGQPGHFRDQCRNRPLPYQNSREQVNTIQESYLSENEPYSEEDTDFDEWDLSLNDKKVREPPIELAPQWPKQSSKFAQAYPAIKEEKAPKAAPYRKRPTRASRPLEPEHPTEMEDDEPEPETLPRSESISEEGLRTKERKRRAFGYDPLKDILGRKADLTFEQLIDIAPAAKAIIKGGLAQHKPTYVNSVQPESITPAYATGEISKRIVSCIVDTGAAISLISHAVMMLLGMSIDKASRTSIIMANGVSSVPLGVIEDVAVTFGECTVSVDMVVTEAASYDVILGMNWLTQANATVDLGRKEMVLSKHGRRTTVPLDCARGVRTEITTQPEHDSDDEPEEDQVNVALDISDNSLDRRARKWRQYTKKAKPETFRPPRYTLPSSDSDDQRPLWQKEAADYYSDGEEEKFFGIPKHQTPSKDTKVAISTGGSAPYHFDNSDDDPASGTEVQMHETTGQQCNDSRPTSPEYTQEHWREFASQAYTPPHHRYYPACYRKICLAGGGRDHHLCVENEESARKNRTLKKANRWHQRLPKPTQEKSTQEDQLAGWITDRVKDFNNRCDALNRWDGATSDWPEGPDPAWMKNDPIPAQPIEQSAYGKRWHESFKKKRCPHGVRIFSPEDECLTCVIECQQPLAQVNTVQAQDYWRAEDPEPPKGPIILVKKLDPKAQIPKQAIADDAGYDLRTLKGISIGPGDTALIDTGIALAIPPGWVGKIHSRSGLAKAGQIARGGVIDPKYRGPILVIMKNDSLKKAEFWPGDRIAQIEFHPVMNRPLKEVWQLAPTDRGSKGIGSTGVHVVRQDLKKAMDIKHQDFSNEKHAYHLGVKLTSRQEEQIRRLMNQYEDVLAVKFEEIRGARTHYKHVIDTGDHKPIKQSPYRLTPHYKQWVQEEIQQMLKSGIIRPSKSPWSSPIVIVPKKDGQGGFAPRMCVDYRKLNAITKLDAYPIPRISDILEYMPPVVKYFSTYDMFMGYNQIGMEEDAVTKSAFVTPDGHYEFLRMPFGPTNAPATFQRAMNEIFGDMVGKGLYVYIDDVTLYSSTFEEHMALTEEFLSRLRRFRFYIKPKKCTIATHEVELLGHLVTQEGIKPSPSKVKAVADYPRPTSKTELRAFLGLIGYYRNFIEGCSRIMQPLSRLLQEHVPFKWYEDGIEEETFIKIKRILIDPHNLLIRPDFDKMFILKTDASALGFGAVLSQMVDKVERPIAYASRRTTKAEANYGSSHLEIAAVLYGIGHFKHYLEGAPFRLVTDHAPLLQLIKLRDPKGMMARYIMRLQPYDIDLVIRPGRKHSDADALSRTPHRPPHHIPYFVQRLAKHKTLKQE